MLPKTKILILLLLTASVANASEEIPEMCHKLSKVTDFYRCETVEVVCYSNDKTQQCWPKPQAKTPDATPTATPSPVKKK